MSVHRRATSRGTRTVPRSPAGLVRGAGRAARVCLFLVLALFALTMAVPGTAHAGFTCDFTGSDNHHVDHPGANGESIFPAVNQWDKDPAKQAKNLNDNAGMVTGAVPMDADHPEDYTLYELNAMRGLDWSMTFKGKGDASESNGDFGSGADDCSIMDYVNNNIADMVFNGTKILTRVAISVKEYASNPSPLSGLYTGRDNAVKTLRDNILVPAVPVMIMLTGLWVFTKWRQQQMREVWAGVGWAALTTIAVLAVLTGGNYVKIVDSADAGIAKANSAMTEAALSGSAGRMQPPCDLAENAHNRGLRISSCAMYDTLTFRPWALGQFGEVGVDCVFKKGSGSVEEGDCDPASASSTCVSGKGARCEDLRVRQVQSQSLNNIEALSGKSFNKIDDEWQKIRQDLAGGEHVEDKKIYPVAFDEWAGKNAGSRVGIAFYSLVAALIVGIMVIVLSALTLLWHAVTLILIIMLPLIATLGIHPSQQKLLKGWLQTFIHSFVLRAGFGIILTVLLVLYQMILPARISLGMQLLMLLLVTVAVVMMLKKLVAGAYSPQIAGAEDALGVGDMANTVAGKAMPVMGVAGGMAAGVAKGTGRVAARAGRGIDDKFNNGRLQEGGWLPQDKSWRARNKGDHQSRVVQQNSYDEAKERQKGKRDEERRRKQVDPPAAGQDGPAPKPHEEPQAPRRTGRVSQTKAAAPQQPAPPAQTPAPAPRPAAPAPAPAPAPPAPAQVPQQPRPRVQPPQPQSPQAPSQPLPPQLPPQQPPRDDNRMPR